ncbi:uncharacterized protein LOC107040163 [Diachasma alloeum]|uniref:uncharacterized protein LOC107040163 n=1 Tax=Diachasma alloeum TaxID=454923 RepID=UPI0007381AF7|nr:uncharacterized protein LOC107040163 [Diachasma alloeum]
MRNAHRKSTPEHTNNSRIDEALAEFFFGCNIPFNVVESEFKKFIKLLNSSYLIPSRKKLSTKLLDQIHQKLIQQLEYTEETDGVLPIDGWKNSLANTKNVVCTIYTKDKRSIFLNSWDFTELRETGDQLANVIDEAVSMSKARFKMNIYGVVSDNASAMMRMGKLVSVWHTCLSHSGNLWLKSLANPHLVECINKLLREFKNPRGERELKKRGGTRIMLACETRWCTYRDTFCCCLRNLDILREIVEEGELTLKAENLELLKDITLEQRLQDYLTLFDPVCELLNKCQRTETRLAEGTELWITLNIATDIDSVDQTLENRLTKLLQPIALTANYVHPEYRGKQFAHIQSFNSAVLTFLREELVGEDPCEWKSLREYAEGKGIFEKLFSKKIKSPEAFWCMAEVDYPTLSGLAKKLSSIPSSTAQIERVFSNWAFIHSDLRNRLSVERSMKSVSIFYAFKMRDTSWEKIDDSMWEED